MAKQIPLGARGEAQETVEFKHTLTAHHPELPPLFHADMIRLMETARVFSRCIPTARATRSALGLRSTSSTVPRVALARTSGPMPCWKAFDGRFYTLGVTPSVWP